MFCECRSFAMLRSHVQNAVDKMKCINKGTNKKRAKESKRKR
jgi:hypothetical protein